MKTLGIVLANVAIALGILMGRMDFEAAHKEHELPPDSEPDSVVAPLEFTSSRTEKAPPRAPSRERHGPVERPTESAAATSDAHPTGTAGAEPRDESAGQGAVDANRFASRLEKAEQLLADHDLKGAQDAAQSILADTARGPVSVHDRAILLAARAKVFERVASRMPKAEPSAPSQSVRKVSEVRLANGTRITALETKVEAERYVFKLQGGGSFAPRKEDVLEIQSTEKEVSSSPRWPEIERKLAKANDTIVLYIDGVERCYRLGLRKEGLGLLARVLSRPDSDKIPLLFIPDADETFLRDWQVAAGRRPPHESSIASGLDASGSEREPPKEGDDRRPTRPEAFDPESGATASSGNDEATQAALNQASQLFGEAQALYQASAGKDGREKDLETAKERVRKALDLVDTLGDSEGVHKLRRQLAQLLTDVARSSPF